MRSLLFPISCLFVFGCNVKENHVKHQVLKPAATATIVISYDSCKNAIRLCKQKQKPVWNRLSKSEKEKILTSAVAETIAPAWIGTSWNFYGTSETPRQGNIACGYFVTTVLRDAGLPISRIKLAQCASEQMITSLIQHKYISRYSNIAMDDFIGSVRNQGYGLYIIGLDSHTGFIYNDGKEIYFIHASYIGSKTVQKEQAASNPILKQSKYKVLGKISSDEQVLELWIH